MQLHLDAPAGEAVERWYLRRGLTFLLLENVEELRQALENTPLADEDVTLEEPATPN